MKPLRDVYGRDLDLNLLRVFAVVADEGSITRAASRLYVTQPAVSAAMRRLASFLGVELFARQGRGVVLTSRGAELLADVRAHLVPLVAATQAPAVFEPKASTATVRIGLSDAMDGLFLPPLLARLRAEAPGVQLIVLPVTFRSVEAALLESRVDIAVSIADELPRSILRAPLEFRFGKTDGFVCVHDPRFSRVKTKGAITEREYFAHGHVAVSYAGDVRGIVEDSLGKTRDVRVSVPSLASVADVVDGSALLATVPHLIADHIRKTRPHLRAVPLPFTLGDAQLELLWTRVTDDNAVARYMRNLLTEVAQAVSSAPAKEHAQKMIKRKKK